MKKTILAIFALLMFAFASVAYAETIEDGFLLNVDVDNDVKPGESFNVDVEVRNNNTADIESIEVEVTVLNIDDGDDLDDDGEVDDLDSGDKDSVDFDFDVPYAVDDKDYNIEVVVTGDDVDNSSRDYRAVWTGTIKVKKDSHALLMKQPTADLETLKCNRVTDIVTTIYNVGNKDEDVDLIVSNAQLGTNQRQSFSLDSGDKDSDIKTTKRVTVDLTNAKPGTYSMLIRAEYDSGDEQESATVNLKVEECVEATPVETTIPEEEVVVQPTQPTTPVNVVPAVVEEPTFMEQYGAALLLGLAYLVVIVIGILLVVNILRKR